MSHTNFRFYAELNDFLPRARQQRGFVHHFEGRVSIKDMVESLGVPHTEIDLLLVNGEPVDFSYLVQDGDSVSVYPLFRSLDVGALSRVRPARLEEPRFVVDVHLGKLAGYLRMLGFDTVYPDDHDDAVLAQISSEERRILLTRDQGLLKRSLVTYGYWVRATDPRRQVVEVFRRFSLSGQVAPFERCVHCNGLLEPVRKGDILDRLKNGTRRYYDEFRRCRACKRIYWKGSHYERMQKFIDWLLHNGEGESDGI